MAVDKLSAHRIQYAEFSLDPCREAFAPGEHFAKEREMIDA